VLAGEAMNSPSAEVQLQFLSQLQRLLSEGHFVATYKFALLQALADLAVEVGDDSGAPLELTVDAIAGKFIQYYWRQSAPYLGRAVLRQNTGSPPAILKDVSACRRRYDSLHRAQADPGNWRRLVGRVARTVRAMPLDKLQTVGNQRLEFLYPSAARSDAIELHAGVAYCLRKFHGLITDLVRGAWTRYIRRFNQQELGNAHDLHDFLFGGPRAAIAGLAPALLDVQSGRCFYCEESLREDRAHVDHFVPWSRYGNDLGHNFVLADASCNAAKSDHIAAPEHLARWIDRNARRGPALEDAFARLAVPHDLVGSLRVAAWVYGQVSASGGLSWVSGKRFASVDAGWDRDLRGFIAALQGA